MASALNNLSDADLQKIAEGKMDHLSDDALRAIAGEESAAPPNLSAQSTAEEPWKPYFKSKEEYEAAVARQATDNPESLASKASMAGRALGSSALKIGLPAAAVAAAPFTGGGSLAALGGASGVLGEYLGNQVAGEETTAGGLASAGIVNAVPGASLVNAGVKEVAKQGAKYALTNAAATYAKKGLDEGELPTGSELGMSAATGFAGAPLSRFLGGRSSRLGEVESAASRDSVRRETLTAGRKLGLVIPPSAVAPSATNDTLQSLAGKAATAQEAILRNQPKVNAAVRAEIGLPADAPLSPISLNTAKVAPNLVYGEVAGMTPASAALLDQFKNATAEANISRQAYRASIDSGKRNPALLAEAQMQDAIADKMRAALNKEAQSVKGGIEIMNRFDAARTRLAQIGLTERAVNPGNGNLDPAVLGQALEHGEKLTGAFKTIGRYENAFGKYLKEASTTPPSGVDYLKGVAKLGLGGGAGYSAGGVPGAVLGMAAMHGAERGSRSLLLNPAYQARFANPFYGTATEDLTAQLARRGSMKLGQK